MKSNRFTADAVVPSAGVPVAVSSSAVERRLVILLPNQASDSRAVEALASAASISPYDARLSLGSTRPRIFRRIDGEHRARALSEQLAAARIAHYVVDDASVRALPVVRARRGELLERHLELLLDQQTLMVHYDELLIFVRGEIERVHHNEKKMATPKGASRSLSPGLLLHLYTRDSSVAAEIDPENFGWPDLGRPASSSALLNLEYFLDALLAKAPDTPVDRGFDHELPVLARSGSSADLEQMLSGMATGRSGVLHDNADQFRFYARWRYRLERHLRAGTDGQPPAMLE